jgi:beta-mannosidase
MTTRNPTQPRSILIRPLVRYVDEAQAVIEVHVRLGPLPEGGVEPARPKAARASARTSELNLANITAMIEMRAPVPGGRTGFEYRRHLDLSSGQGMVRFVMPDPDRWWPAGMGEQWLYDLAITLLDGDTVLEQSVTTIGLTSVRSPAPRLVPLAACPPVPEPPKANVPPNAATMLLINGQPCRIQSVTDIDARDERRLLPVSSDSLLVIHGHLAPDRLLDAADRAGVLMIQSLPSVPALDPANDAPDVQDTLARIERLTAHPCLAGWFVGHAGLMSERLIQRVHDLDPSRNIFRVLPKAADKKQVRACPDSL